MWTISSRSSIFLAGASRLQQLPGDAFRLFQRAVRQQHGKVAAVVARQQRARIA
jgi:hypothetical protein